MRTTILSIVALALVLITNSSRAQGWERVYDLGGNEQGEVMVAIDSGYVMGIENNFDEWFTDRDMVIVQFDFQGNIVRQSAFPAFVGRFWDITQTANGDFVAVGELQDTTGGNNETYQFMIRYAPDLSIRWMKYTPQDFFHQDIKELPSGELLASGRSSTYFCGGVKYSSAGDSLEVFSYTTGQGSDGGVIVDVLPTLDGQFMAISVVTYPQPIGSDLSLAKLNTNGDTLFTNTIYSPTPHNLLSACATADSGFALAGFNYVPFNSEPFVIKTDAEGNVIWSRTYNIPGDTALGIGIVEDPQGKLLVTLSSTTTNREYLMFLDSSGNEIERKIIKAPTPNNRLLNIYRLFNNPSGGYDLFTTEWDTLNPGTENSHNIVLIHTDSLGNIFSALIQGTVFNDINNSCLPDNGDAYPEGIVIVATDSSQNYYAGISEANGRFFIAANPGNYQLSTILPSPYWTDFNCGPLPTVSIMQAGDTAYQDYPVQKNILCPDLQVQVATPFIRCVNTSPITLHYCNNGTADAVNAYIDLTLDSITIASASSAYTSLGDQVYRFQLGTLAEGACNTITITPSIPCNLGLGQSVCIEAHIYPDSICLPPDPLWDGSHLVLSSECAPDSVAFFVKNTGNNMLQRSSYTIIQDDVLYAVGNLQLGNGQSFTRRVPANGNTWTFITHQAVGHPGFDHPLRSVEGCGTNGMGAYSIGYLPQFPQNDADAFVDILCRPYLGSFDPNDKMPEPLGIGVQGLIDSTQQLTYQIRFQNTGSDTAFTVVVRDTLPDELNIGTLRNIKASHPFSTQIEYGNVLAFTFDNILLPDSNTNEAGSHGYVSFEIYPQKGLEAGTIIQNTAAIYFDYNPPVITNTTINTIDGLYNKWFSVSVTETYDPTGRVHCYPNPSSGFVNVEYSGAKTATMLIYDLAGRLQLQQELGSRNTIDVSAMKKGMYLYEIRTPAQKTAGGKLVIY